MNKVPLLLFAVGLAAGATYYLMAPKEYVWDLPKDIPPPVVPQDNPMSTAKVELGRHLFYDTRLSANDTVSCATCHEQDKAFTDGKKVSTGLHGDLTPRNSMSLTNVAYNPNFTWAATLLTKLETQARNPLFGEMPPEMGLSGKEHIALTKIKADERYQALFKAAYPSEPDPVNMDKIIDAIASFERVLISFESPYDHYLRGDKSAISESQKRGMQLFFSEKTECFHCHGGFNFTDSSVHENTAIPPARFHNNGLYNVDGKGGYPKSDQGLYKLTSDIKDMGKFKAPTLRNIAVTGPYMHDGSIETLEAVVDHYSNGGRDIREGDNRGFGTISPLKSPFVKGFKITAEERQDLLNFLHSLTDPKFLNNPAFANPWQ